LIGNLETFNPHMRTPKFETKIRQGHTASRKPRNTCLKCNGGWMRDIEEAMIPIMPALIFGQPHYLLQVLSQRFLAAFLCLVSMRIEISSHTQGSIPKPDRAWLRKHWEPPPHWRIWIARHEGPPAMDERFAGMHIASSPNVETGVEY